MRKFIILSLISVLLISTVSSTEVSLSQFFGDKEVREIETLKESRWGKLYFNLAEIVSGLKDPIDDLIGGLKKLIANSKKAKEAEQAEHDKNELFHNREIDYLKNQIRSAEDDVTTYTSRLNNVLLPTKKQLAETIRNLKSDLAANIRTQAKEVANRKAEKAIYDAIAAEHNEAIESLDQAIRVVSSLLNKQTFLVEVVIYQHSMNKLAAALRRQDKYAPLVNTLIQFANKLQTKDVTSIRGCIKLLNELRESLVNDLNEYTRVENEHIKAHNERMASLKEDQDELTKRLAQEVLNEVENNKAIVNAKNFISTRQNDLKLFRKQVVDENNRWVQVVALHDQFVKDIDEEISTAEQTHNYLSSASFGNYLRRKLQASSTF